MRMRTVRRSGLIGLLAATSMIIGGLPASADAGDGSAYGLSVSVTLLGGDPIAIGPLPVANADGPTDVSLISASVPGVLTVGVLNASASRDDITGEVDSRASTADLTFGAPPVNGISITLLEATCVATQSGVTGNTRLVGAELGALGDVDASPPPNTVIEVPGLLPGTTIVSITFNEQINNPDGSLTVNAVHIRLLDGVLGSIGSGDIIISQARCGPAAPPVPMASGAGLWLSLGVLGMAVVPVAVVLRRRQVAGRAV
jgi:hypothetical protein